jgi:hypothetical protein
MHLTLISEKEHKQSPIYVDDELVFTVDESLQSLIQFLTDFDFITFNSCQDNIQDTCWIEFYLSDWLQLSEISFQSETKSLVQFIEDECEVLLLSCDDGCPDKNDEYWITGENLIWSASVRFNKKLIPDFEEIIRNTIEDSSIFSKRD